jgi:hypothetical protein
VKEVEPTPCLSGGHPAGLTEIVTVCLATNFDLRVGAQVSIVAIIKVDFVGHESTSARRQWS